MRCKGLLAEWRFRAKSLLFATCGTVQVVLAIGSGFPMHAANAPQGNVGLPPGTVSLLDVYKVAALISIQFNNSDHIDSMYNQAL